VLIDAGESPVNAGALLGLTTFVGVPTGLLLSSLFSKFRNLGPLGFGLSMLSASGFILVAVGREFTVLGCVLIGLGTSATFPLSLTLISIKASTKAQTTTLSAVAQGYGYLLAAVGTFLFGFLKDLTSTWLLSLVGLVVLTFLQALAVLVAGRPKVIPAT
jgi:CP family cyanate transporter-like MFS transporter